MSSKLLTNILCLTLLSVSALATFLGYQRLELEISNRESIVPNLQLGKANYSVLLNEECFGVVNSELKVDDGFLLDISGNFNFAVESQPVPVLVKFFAQFNTLGQAGIMSLKIMAGERVISILAKGINPIEVELQSFGDQNGLGFKQRLQGPMLLRQLADGSFALEFSRVDNALSSQNPLFSQKLFQTLKPDILEEGTETSRRCHSEQLRPLEVGGYLKMAQNLIQSLQFLRGQQ